MIAIRTCSGDRSRRGVSGVGRRLSAIRNPYLIGGSVVSAAHGLPRQTNDIDIVAGIPIPILPEFYDSLGPAFDASAEFAVRSRGRAARSM